MIVKMLAILGIFMLMSSPSTGHMNHGNVTELPDCDLSQATIEHCKIEIMSTWNVTQHTLVNEVDIVCSTPADIECINLARDLNLEMMSVMITSNSKARCIRMEGSAVLLARNLIANNCGSTTSGGGGLLYGGYNTVTLIDSRIHDSQGSSGGAIELYNGNLTLENTSIIGSTATYEGGAIYLRGGSHMFTNSNLQYNTAGYYDGGALLLYSGEVIIKDTVIEHNTAGRSGGGIYLYTDTYNPKSVLHLMSGNSILYNKASVEPGLSDIRCYGLTGIQQSNADMIITCLDENS